MCNCTGRNERPVASITDDEAAIMLADIAIRRGKKANANQTKHILHGMFKWAKQPGRKFVTVNPFADLPAPGGTITPRDRFLSADEIRQVWHALDDPESLGIKPGGAARHGVWHDRRRASRLAQAERTRAALVTRAARSCCIYLPVPSRSIACITGTSRFLCSSQ
jgi:hypothetical protein